MLRTIWLLALIFLTACSPSTPEPTSITPSSKTSEEKSEVGPEYQPGAEDVRNRFVAYLNSDKEKSIINAKFFSAKHLVVAMKNTGGSFDGWAESVCLMANEQGLITNGTRIEIIDAMKMLKEEFFSIGSNYCVATGEAPTLVEFN